MDVGVQDQTNDVKGSKKERETEVTGGTVRRERGRGTPESGPARRDGKGGRTVGLVVTGGRHLTERRRKDDDSVGLVTSIIVQSHSRS